MEFTVNYRKKLYINFYDDINKTLKKEYDIIHNKHDNIQNNLIKLYPTKQIARGAEGIVYLSHTKNVKNFIIKSVDLNAIFHNKALNKKILNKNPLQIYELFYRMKKNINMPSLIENICYTLTNQLVFQNICPHFGLNYYWEYTTDNKIIYYNEYANYSTFFDWAKTSRSQQEWMNLLVQIIISIICMRKYFNIIHGDLHSLNILIYKVQDGGYWKYIIDDKQYIVPNLGWVVLISDFGFATVSSHVYVLWYYDSYLKGVPQKTKIFYDFVYLSNDLIKQRQPVKNLLKESIGKIKSSSKYTLINLLDDYYKEIIQPSAKPTKFIDTYDLNKQLNKMLLPENFRHLARF